MAKVKNEARKIAKENNKVLIIINGSPDNRCPVISSFSGADFVVLVTELTISGLHDLIRVYELVKKFQIRAGCRIIKSDLNPQISDEIEKFLVEEGN